MIILEFPLTIINMILFNEIRRWNRFSMIMNLKKTKKRGELEKSKVFFFKEKCINERNTSLSKIAGRIEHKEIVNNTI